MVNISDFLEKLTAATHQSEPEIMAQALQTGLQQLWREHILGCYIRGEISRQEAVENAGIDWVELAERQHQAAMEDVAWGMNL